VLSPSLVCQPLGVDLDVHLLFRRELRRGQVPEAPLVSSWRKFSGNLARRLKVNSALLQIVGQMALLLFQRCSYRLAEFALRRRLDKRTGYPFQDRSGFRVLECVSDRPPLRRFDHQEMKSL